jgi:FlaA1/EpsC-like NDP-sugar epimerase
MWHQWKNPSFYLMLFFDALIFTVAFIAAYLLRFEFHLTPTEVTQLKMISPYLVVLKLAIFSAFGLYQGIWRYTSLRDLVKLAQASFLSTLLIVGALLYIHRFGGFSRAVFAIDGLLTFLMAAGSRLIARWRHERKTGSTPLQGFGASDISDVSHGVNKRVVIIGAGDAGEKILREINDHSQLRQQIKPLGFLDDDPGKWGRSVHRLPVFGPVSKLPKVIEKHRVQEAFIAMPSATGAQIRHIAEICKRASIPYKTLPGMGEIIEGSVSIKALRDVNYQDLLGRQPVQLNSRGISDYLSGKVVMVTGCGGSIGSELCRQLVPFEPGQLVLVDAGEANLFHIQMELHHEMRYRNYCTILGQVQDRLLMRHVFDQFRPEVVFHAAAYKHVPLLERNPWEAVFNNILGSQMVMEMAREYGSKRFVLVSTDKAVRPTNVMGASKRIAELLLQSFQGNGTLFMAVRFGNVVGSSGSVVPLFRRQIEKGGPVTVTHPEVTRYFMTIPEAAKLILQAGALGEGGEIFILEMGTPVKIADMARDLIRLSGKEPEKDIEIIFTGLREGEKLYEELITVGEGITKTPHEKILVLRASDWQGFESPDGLRCWLQSSVEELQQLAVRHDAPAIRQKLKEIVPEYTTQTDDCAF